MDPTTTGERINLVLYDRKTGPTGPELRAAMTATVSQRRSGRSAVRSRHRTASCWTNDDDAGGRRKKNDAVVDDDDDNDCDDGASSATERLGCLLMNIHSIIIVIAVTNHLRDVVESLETCYCRYVKLPRNQTHKNLTDRYLGVRRKIK